MDHTIVISLLLWVVAAVSFLVGFVVGSRLTVITGNSVLPLDKPMFSTRTETRPAGTVYMTPDHEERIERVIDERDNTDDEGDF